MSKTIQYVPTADGDQAVRIAHLVMCLVPQKDGTMRTMTAWPARDPGTCTRGDFHPGGFRSTDLDGFRSEAEAYAQHHEELEGLQRRLLDRATTRSFDTPWGTPDEAREYGDGVVSVNCPGHGGYLVSATANDLVAAPWRNPVGPGGWAFYEEDCESAIVRHSMPDLFTAWERENDQRNLRSFMPDEWEAVTGATLLPGQSITRDRENFLKTNADRFVATSAIRSKDEPGMVVVTAYRGGRDPRGRTIGAPRTFLVQQDEYDRRRETSGVWEFLVDDHDQELGRDGTPLPIAA